VYPSPANDAWHRILLPREYCPPFGRSSYRKASLHTVLGVNNLRISGSDLGRHTVPSSDNEPGRRGIAVALVVREGLRGFVILCATIYIIKRCGIINSTL